jgi:hypothetical protein
MYNEVGRKKSFSAYFFKIFLKKQKTAAKLNAGTRACGRVYRYNQAAWLTH